MTSNSSNRPKLKIPKTKSEQVWDIIGYIFYFGSIILLIYVWRMLPEEVPAHYNGYGEVDRLGSKFELIILPVISVIILITMQLLEKNPHVHNYPDRLNESNAKEFYINSRKQLNQLKNICVIIFSIILFDSVIVALGWGEGFNRWILPIIIVGTILPIVIGLIKQRKIK